MRMNQQDTHKENLEFNKLQKKLRRNVGNAITEYNMIEESDVVMACISGGKDSFAMLDILLGLQKSAPINFKVIAVNLDQKQPGFPEHILPNYFESLGIPYYIVDKDTYSVVREKIPEGKTTCGLCSRLRRGTLYSFAEKIGATKIALGHHMDDMVETMFLNMFYGSRLKSMPPKLRSDDQRNVVIRPLTYCREKDLIAYAEYREYPIIPCNLCGSQENLQRQNIKAMLIDWDTQTPGRVESIFKSTQNISPSQLADRNIFDFENLPLDRTGKRAEYEFTEAEVSSSNINIDESMFIDVTNI
ncbi:Putative ATPase [Photobacterium profundum SS9]|uniref:tRNA-cytidine(32) 2-sulfurtransferase n=2 Tax=Photobacterium profundum TaxID=74109 RepID=TTCA_PHOPR|nr:RecName: Full=tRNA-cytidine(32) 2-sulfurtransferase; AltName: Full=Two-thiocytidine biosynthesis protein A; AltName: Full=tRNA 2-thiocytidine biosynthesis protein TtcA [Photobacterium profundum SS9]CAG20245.1 Putative ATPase [Photobacterium profundum SS9]